MIGAEAVNLLLLLVGVVTAVIAVVLAVVAIRRARRDPGPGRARLTRLESAVIALVGAGGIVAVPLSVFALAASAIAISTARSVFVSDVATGGVYPEALYNSDAPVDASYANAWIDVANLPGGIRFLLWAEGALPTLAALVIGLAVAWLAFALLRGRPFTRALPVVLGVVAIVVVGAGLGTQVLGAIARAETVAFLGPPELITGPGGFAAFSLSLDLAPLGWGLGIALVAAAFDIGTRLQKDAEGLV